MRGPLRVDLSMYARALPVYFTNPLIALAPFLAALTSMLLGMLIGSGGGIAGLLQILIHGFGLSVAILTADLAWRGQRRDTFDAACREARYRASDILFSTLGVSFVLYAAGLVGSLVGPLAIVLELAAAGFLIYALPATTIGGVPGGSAALEASIARAREYPYETLVVAISSLTIVVAAFFGAAGVEATVDLATGISIAGAIAGSLIRAIALGYVALILAKSYIDLSYGHRR